MTYSHNSVSKNLKMTTAATATAAASSRLKNGAVESGKTSGDGVAGNSPPSTPPLCAHSNSIASNSTNYQFHHHQPMLSSSPPGSYMSSAMSTSSNTSSSSSVSSLASNSHGYFSMRKQQRQPQQQQQQRRSPQQQHSESGSYFNNINHQKSGSGTKRNSGSSVSTPKNRDGIMRSPQNYHQSTRQSPASILGGGISISPTISSSIGGNNSARKPRSKHSSPLLCVGSGMVSPTHSVIPTALTHFAGSKCFDAPAPTALPKPPDHWTGSKSAEKVASSAGPGLQCILNAVAARTNHIHYRHGVAHECRSYGGHVVKSSKRNLLDDFDTHNLKLLLNVQS